MTVSAVKLFVYPNDLIKVYAGKINFKRSAINKYNTLKQLIGKQSHQYITIKELADWEGITEDELLKILD